MVNKDSNQPINTSTIHQINFKSIKYFSSLFNIILICITSCIVGFLFVAYSENNLFNCLLIILVGSVLFIITLAFRYFIPRSYAIPLKFTVDFIEIPRRQNATTHDKVSYSAIKSIDIRGKGNQKILIISTLSKTYMFLLRTIKESQEKIEDIIKVSFLQNKEGRAIWENLQKNTTNAKTLLSFKVKATITLSIINIAVYVFGTWLDGSSLFNLINLGANSHILIDSGQWERLFTANFLHNGFVHVYLNVINLFLIGSILERLIGWQKFLIIYLFSCFSGALLSYFAQFSIVSVGASTGIFGLLGSLLYINYKLGIRLPTGFNLNKKNWMIILGINILLPFLIPQIDWVAHVGGFISGVFVTWCLLRLSINSQIKTDEIFYLWRINSPKVMLVTLGVCSLFVFTFIDRISAYENRDQDLKVLSESLIQFLATSPDSANNLAWSIVQNEQSSAEELAWTSNMMNSVIHSSSFKDKNITSEEKAEFLDTYALILYKQSFFDDAIEAEYQAIIYNEKDYFLSQLSQYIFAKMMTLELSTKTEIETYGFKINNSNGLFIVNKIPSQGENTPTTVIVHKRLKQKNQGMFICTFVNEKVLTLNNDNISQSLNKERYIISAVNTKRLGRSKDDTCRFFVS